MGVALMWMFDPVASTSLSNCSHVEVKEKGESMILISIDKDIELANFQPLKMGP